ncbi:MBL fold metallo-hydrolase [Allorhizocola rhizosphaerae]|uniref:MBL fold metallo-hydrolase n=1 Tax=Allorhizocola rhizosphaerae TaxID=1872709 RepID=UPI000E3EA537|nr:MBL fold metallo-hydrolase [Allorhizocola rhizosphaerae]
MTDGALQTLAPGVFAYVQPDGGWCVNNAGIIAGPETTVVIDTAATERRSKQLKQAVATVAPNGANLVVNTHFHGDHVFGNAQFAPGAVIVAHERCRSEMIEAGLGLTNLWPDVEWGEIVLTPPVLTFEDRLTIHNGDRRIELIHVGPAHTTNDIVIWVPDERILFAGDVIMSGVTPFCLMGSVAGSLRAIERLRALDPAVIVAGHGEVGGPELLDANESYLRWIQGLAHNGQSIMDAARQADLGDFGKLLDSERLIGNLHRAFAERDGSTDVNVLKAFQDMVAFHGRLPDCQA